MKMPLMTFRATLMLAGALLPAANASAEGLLKGWTGTKEKVVVSSTQVTVVSATVMDGHGTVSVAPTAEQAERAYQAARTSFMAVASGGEDVSVTTLVSGTGPVEDAIRGGKSENIALENIRIVLDVDNVTLREVMAQIVKQAANYSGPWTVKWRLQPANMGLLDERVNLTAEANFGEFCDLLTERVKNMTGTQLFVTAFAGTRVLLVADTYY